LGTLTVAWLGTVEYLRALELQNGLVRARLRDEVRDVLLLLEHPHVYTLGRGADQRFVLDAAALPVHRVSRGGQVTYHGPGQLIGYPIVKLEDGQRDVVHYLRQLEQVVIETLATVGIAGERLSGLTGVWVGQEKIASIGVGFRRWVSLHGFALNVTTDLSYFDAIVPCGIPDCRMTSIAARGLRTVSCEAAGQIVAGQFATVFGYDHIVWEEERQVFTAADAGLPLCDTRK
jgi:lipoyl(octanoyl) transferase